MLNQTSLEFNKLDISSIDVAKKLLEQNNLPYQDIEDENVEVFALTYNSSLIGTIGLEAYGNIALLRSMATDKKYRDQGYGKYLFDEIIKHCKSKNINELYLLTCTADKYFKKLGFKQIFRDRLPNEIKQTKQFSQLCPCSAICMELKI